MTIYEDYDYNAINYNDCRNGDDFYGNDGGLSLNDLFF